MEKPTPPIITKTVNFGDVFYLHNANLNQDDLLNLELELLWATDTAVSPTTTAFVQIIENDNVLAQSDLPPGGGNWPAHWWQSQQIIQETRTITLPKPFNPAQHKIFIGIYDAATLERLPILAEDGSIMGDSWHYLPAE